jgi:toxin ParE1/3/4
MPGVQKFRLTQFPFSLLYINGADYLWVVAVAHGSRKPGYWKQRAV